ncbi:MAG: DUF4915 domain-containing protein, partial [Proteobacteria bacterium]|nr:DUF4915 domain-containing protein [Pseudomonadota bacterium]
MSAPNDSGGLFAIVKGQSKRLDHVSSTGLSVAGGFACRGVQPDVLEGIDNLPELNISDVHDVLIRDTSLFVASTGTNEIVEIDLHNNSIRRHGFPGTGDAWHINCLAEFNGEIIFSAFGKFSEDRGYKGQTLGNGFVASLSSGKELIRGLSQPHSLLVSGGHLYVIDSETGCLNEYDSGFCLKRSLTLGLYPRGLLIRHGVIFVGLSASRNIDGSTVSSAQLLAIDHVDFEKKASLELDAKEIYVVSHLHANPQMTLFVSAANRSACQLQSTRTRLAELQGEHERVGAWGQAQERELQSMRTRLAELQGEHERVGAWGQAQERELQSTR